MNKKTTINRVREVLYECLDYFFIKGDNTQLDIVDDDIWKGGKILEVYFKLNEHHTITDRELRNLDRHGFSHYTIRYEGQQNPEWIPKSDKPFYHNYRMVLRIRLRRFEK